jgi:hypothetical protein
MTEMVNMMICTSNVFLIIVTTFSLVKILLAMTAGIAGYGTCSESLTWWVLLSPVFDILTICLYVVRYRMGQEIRQHLRAEEPLWIANAAKLLALGFFCWQIPGNVFYWTDECGGFLGGAALFLLICGYLYMLSPCIILVLICLCLPCIVLLVMRYMARAGQLNEATEEKISTLETANYNPEVHKPNTACSI